MFEIKTKAVNAETYIPEGFKDSGVEFDIEGLSSRAASLTFGLDGGARLERAFMSGVRAVRGLSINGKEIRSAPEFLAAMTAGTSVELNTLFLLVGARILEISRFDEEAEKN